MQWKMMGTLARCRTPMPHAMPPAKPDPMAWLRLLQLSGASASGTKFHKLSEHTDGNSNQPFPFPPAF